MEALLRFESVSKSFRGNLVLDNFSFSLNQGEVIALLGPSGCGKTTILNIAAGLIRQSGGTVSVHTEELGYVFQEPRLIPWKTILDNVLFALEKDEKKAKMEKARAVLQKVGLEHVSHFYPKQLSGGMKQRVSIARALVVDPKVILMDEPFSALDVSLKKELQQDVIRLIEEHGIGVLYVTHDPEEAARLADRVLIFSKSCSSANEIPLPVNRSERDEADIVRIKKELQMTLTGG
ncbi:ABC transporter ATP-binding protein [Brevibacillus sp. SYSU BS000544]|uniref:ABC transporter ATP-binding protein n=1 Tax=Brevibacillus sp. SYSU BS000544 TaxID=3416443 RepID=UPI003CE59B9B